MFTANEYNGIKKILFKLPLPDVFTFRLQLTCGGCSIASLTLYTKFHCRPNMLKTHLERNPVNDKDDVL